MERWPIAGSFTISRGAKTEAVTVVAEVSYRGHTGRGECVPYPRYGETPEATLAALQGGLLLTQLQRDTRPLEVTLDTMLDRVQTLTTEWSRSGGSG